MSSTTHQGIPMGAQESQAPLFAKCFAGCFLGSPRLHLNLGCRSRRPFGKVFVLPECRCRHRLPPRPRRLGNGDFETRAGRERCAAEQTAGGGEIPREKHFNAPPWHPGVLAPQLCLGVGGLWCCPPHRGGFGVLSVESRNFSDDRMVCREIRRNSAGCLRMRDECEKCRDILAVGQRGDGEGGMDTFRGGTWGARGCRHWG